ncbi:MAG: ATPase, T2SS/T4P/T4SS family [Candidatus Micrarchaeota archaeon]|nr:ATPase, T2SS/T4P/T4SS family [Candidatus Micrarchaeota archaeon]
MLGYSYETREIEYDLDIPIITQNESIFLNDFLITDFDLTNLKDSLTSFAYDKGYYLSPDQFDRFEKLIKILVSNTVFFDRPLRDNNVEEIAIIGLNKPVYVYVKGKGWLKTGLKITDRSFFIELVNRLARESGRRITYSIPYLNANISNIGRLHATLNPISDCELTIRKFNLIPYSLCEFVSSNIISSDVAALLWLLVLSDSSIIISGNTASGKTSLLNALSSFFSQNERILVIEETRELNFINDHVVHLSEFGDIRLKHLIWDSLRMRPDRLVIGEIRKKEEAEALVECMLSGQARSFYTTMHANSSREVLKRFENYGISNDVISVSDAILNLRRFRQLTDNNGKKELIEIRELNDIYFPRADLLIRHSALSSPTSFRTFYESLDEQTKFKMSKVGISDYDMLMKFVNIAKDILGQKLAFYELSKKVDEIYAKL